jgi:hypothetical protein
MALTIFEYFNEYGFPCKAYIPRCNVRQVEFQNYLPDDRRADSAFDHNEALVLMICYEPTTSHWTEIPVAGYRHQSDKYKKELIANYGMAMLNDLDPSYPDVDVIWKYDRAELHWNRTLGRESK